MRADREVVFVEDVVCGRAFTDGEYLEFWRYPVTDGFPQPDTCINLEVRRRIVPIFRICNLGRQDVFIAWSDDVEEKLGLPIRAIKRSQEEAAAEARRQAGRLTDVKAALAGLTWRERLWFLIKRELPGRVPL